MELPIDQQKTSSRKEFWQTHIESALQFGGTNKQYCLIHDLDPGSFNAYRKKLGYSKPRRKVDRPAAFSEVLIKPQPKESSSVKLPDPLWLAEFLKAWGKLS